MAAFSLWKDVAILFCLLYQVAANIRERMQLFAMCLAITHHLCMVVIERGNKKNLEYPK